MAWTTIGARPSDGSSSRSDARLRHQRPADREHLLLAAGERARRLAQPLLQAREQGEDPLEIGRDAAVPARVGAHLEVLGTVRFAKTLRPSGTMDEAARARAGASGWRVGSPSNRTSPARARTRPGDRAQRRRLAGAVGADQGHDLALGQRQRHALERVDGAVGHRQVRGPRGSRSRAPQVRLDHLRVALDLGRRPDRRSSRRSRSPASSRRCPSRPSCCARREGWSCRTRRGASGSSSISSCDSWGFMPAAGSSSSSSLRLGRERAGDLEPPLAAVGQARWRRSSARWSRPKIFSSSRRVPADALLLGAVGARAQHGVVSVVACRQVKRRHDVVEHRHVAEQADVLERARDPQPGDPLRLRPRSSCRRSGCPLGRRVDAGHHVEDRRLARAVRADQAVERGPARISSVERLDGREAAEAHRHPGQLEGRTCRDTLGRPGWCRARLRAHGGGGPGTSRTPVARRAPAAGRSSARSAAASRAPSGTAGELRAAPRAADGQSAAPSTAPVIEPMPPSTIMTMTSIDLHEGERVGVDVHQVVGEEAARHAREGARHDEREHLGAGRVDAHRLGRDLVLADGDQRAPERRVDDAGDDQDRQRPRTKRSRRSW